MAVRALHMSLTSILLRPFRGLVDSAPVKMPFFSAKLGLKVNDFSAEIRFLLGYQATQLQPKRIIMQAVLRWTPSCLLVPPPTVGQSQDLAVPPLPQTPTYSSVPYSSSTAALPLSSQGSFMMERECLMVALLGISAP